MSFGLEHLTHRSSPSKQIRHNIVRMCYDFADSLIDKIKQ